MRNEPTTTRADRTSREKAAKPAHRAVSIVIAACGDHPEHGEHARTWWAGCVERGWPSGVPPHADWFMLADLPVRTDCKAAVEQSAAVILMTSPKTDRATLLRAVNVVREAGRAAIVLSAADHVTLSTRLEGEGIVQMHAGADPASVAGVLTGLIAMREPLRRLEKELELSNHQQASARRWIRRVDDELHTAARMQRDLLPKQMPSLGCIETASLFRPLWHVSGDIYRVWRLDEHRLGFMIADAMGHGVRAAMATMIVAHELVLKEVDGADYRILPPATALARLNEQMVNHPSEAMKFASALCGVVDCETGVLEIAAAGHPHPFLIGPDGSLRVVELDGPVLGVFDQAEFVQTTLHLAAGETLLMYTDGAEDALACTSEHSIGNNATADKQGLMCSAMLRCLCEPAVLRLGERLDLFNAMLDSMPGSLHRADDITLLGIRRK